MEAAGTLAASLQCNLITTQAPIFSSQTTRPCQAGSLLTTICSPNFQLLEKKVIISTTFYTGINLSFPGLAQEGCFPPGGAGRIGYWDIAAKTNLLPKLIKCQSFGERRDNLQISQLFSSGFNIYILFYANSHPFNGWTCGLWVFLDLACCSKLVSHYYRFSDYFV